MKTRLFSMKVAAFTDDSLVDMPGFSHRSQPFKTACSWYPFEDWRVRAYVFAKNRTNAIKQLARVGLSSVRDLDGGIFYECPKCLENVVTQ